MSDPIEVVMEEAPPARPPPGSLVFMGLLGATRVLLLAARSLNGCDEIQVMARYPERCAPVQPPDGDVGASPRWSGVPRRRAPGCSRSPAWSRPDPEPGLAAGGQRSLDGSDLRVVGSHDQDVGGFH